MTLTQSTRPLQTIPYRMVMPADEPNQDDLSKLVLSIVVAGNDSMRGTTIGKYLLTHGRNPYRSSDIDVILQATVAYADPQQLESAIKASTAEWIEEHKVPMKQKVNNVGLLAASIVLRSLDDRKRQARQMALSAEPRETRSEYVQQMHDLERTQQKYRDEFIPQGMFAVTIAGTQGLPEDHPFYVPAMRVDFRNTPPKVFGNTEVTGRGLAKVRYLKI